MLPQMRLACGAGQVIDNVGRGQPHQSIQTEMGLIENALERHGLPSIAIVDSLRCFAVDMDDLGLRRVVDRVPRLQGPFRPGDVLEPG